MTFTLKFPGRIIGGTFPAWIFVSLITILLYYHTLDYGMLYNYDDDAYFNDPTLRVLNTQNTLHYFESYYLGMYQPLPVLSYALVMKYLPGTDMQRIVNLLFHLVNALLVIILVRRLTGNAVVGALSGLLFAIHPMHTESVSWLSTRGNLMYSLFYLSALIFYLKWRKEGTKASLVLLFLMALLSCFSKVTAATLPLMILVLDLVWARVGLKRALCIFIPLMAIASVFIWAGINASGSFGHISELKADYSLFERFILILNAVWVYLWKAILPLDQSVIYLYPWKSSGSLPGSYYLGGVVSFLVLGLTLWHSWKNRASEHWRMVFTGLLIFLISISIVLPLKWSRTILLAERYTYVPYIGIFLSILVIGRYYYSISGKWLRIIPVALLSAMLAYYGYSTYERNKVWQNPVTLFTDVVLHGRSDAEKSMGYYNRGNERLRLGDLGNAEYDYSMALKLDPDFGKAYFNRGIVLFNMKDNEGAIESLSQAIRVDSINPDAYLNRGVALRAAGRFNEAKDDFDRSAELYANPLVFFNRGALYYFNLGDSIQACNDWKKAYSMGYMPAAEVLNKFCK